MKVADAGKYMVRAVNAGGEAQSIADFAVIEPTPERMVEVVKTVTFENVRGDQKVPSNTNFKSITIFLNNTKNKITFKFSSFSLYLWLNLCPTQFKHCVPQKYLSLTHTKIGGGGEHR